ncbi:MAG: hypothetical protein SWK90_18515 [Chloroflexota bacterium]|nr:hypothetical protein [Chloroflexota bacterium]
MEKKRDRPSPATYTEARSEIEHLVGRFARNLDAYKRTEYKEAHVQVEFIAPFFEALGWDVRNVRGYAEQYKEAKDTKGSFAVFAPFRYFRVSEPLQTESIATPMMINCQEGELCTATCNLKMTIYPCAHLAPGWLISCTTWNTRSTCLKPQCVINHGARGIT